MTRWVALLRGVNVGGITVRSGPLGELFRDLRLDAVRTVLASGNVAFDSGDGDGLKERIEAGLRERFGYDAWIVLEPQDRLAVVAAAFPFERDDAATHPYVVFGSDAAILEALATEAEGVADAALEEVRRGDGVVYWRVPKGSSTETPVAKVLARSRWRSTTTTRTLRTVEKLVTA